MSMCSGHRSVFRTEGQGRSALTSYVAAVLGAVMVWQPVLAFAAEPVPVQGAATTTLEAPNGVPVVNINPANSAGVSHNLYQRFDVGSEGAILNNSREITQTELGGYIEANPNLARGSASLILNEVVASNPSSLNGFVEVAGRQAEVVIANPWGITCNGCGFLNASRATLTTGVPELDGRGALDHFSVTGGAVTFEGAEANLTHIDRFDVIARAVVVNSALHGNDINLLTGAGDADYEQMSFTSEALGDAPALAISSSALGGIYGDRISLVATEAGVGVHLDAPVAAQTGDMELLADGTLRYRDVAAAGDLLTEAAAVQAQGDTYAGGRWQVDTGALSLGDGMHLAGEVAVTATDVQVSDGATLLADDAAGEGVQLNVTSLTNAGTVRSYADLEVDAAAALSNQGTLAADQQLTASADTLTNSGGIGAGADMTLAASAVENLEAGGDAALILSGGNLSIWTDQMTNRGSDIYAGGELTLAASDALDQAALFENHSGFVQSGGNMTLYADHLDNRRTAFDYQDTYDWGYIRMFCTSCGGDKAAGHFQVREFFETDITADSGRSEILAGGDLYFRGNELDNYYSSLLSLGDMTLEVSDSIDNVGINAAGYMDFYYHLTGHIDEAYVAYYVDRANRYNRHNSKYRTGFDIDWSRENPNFDPEQFQEYENNPISRLYLTNTYRQFNDEAGNSIAGAKIVAGGTLTITGGATLDVDTAPGYLVEEYGTDLPPLAGPATAPTDPVDGVDDFLGRVNGGLLSFAPAGSGYLIESSPLATNFSQFISSQYLLDRLGWLPEDDLIRLGDGFVEQRLLQDALLQTTGRLLLSDDFTSQDEQFRFLMDNAVYAAESLELSPGVALTADQINNLQADMVWLEEKEVMGHRVLVPTLYLANESARLRADGTLVAGSAVDMDVASLSNRGAAISSDSDLSLTVGDGGVHNFEGEITAAGTLAMSSAGDVTNISGLLSGDQVHIEAGGNITNTRAVNVQQYDSAIGYGTRTDFGRAGTLAATGDMTLRSGGDITVAGSRIDAGSALLAADGNVSVESLRDVEERRAGPGRYFSHRLDVTQVASEISTTLDLLVQAGEDVSVVASHLQAGGSLGVQAGGDITVASAEELRHRDYSWKDDDDKFRLTDTRTTQAGASLSAGKDMALDAGANLTVVASELDAGEDLSLAARENVTVASAMETRSFSFFKKEDKVYGEKAKQAQSYDETVAQSSLQAGGDVLINTVRTAEGDIAVRNDAAGDVVLQAVDVTAGGDAAVYAGNNLLVTAQTAEHAAHRETTRSYSGWAKALADVAGLGLASIGSAVYAMTGQEASFELKSAEQLGRTSQDLTDTAFNTSGTYLLSGGDTTVMAGDFDGMSLSVNAGMNSDTGGAVHLLGLQTHSSAYKEETTLAFGQSQGFGSLSHKAENEESVQASHTDWQGTEITMDGDIDIQAAGDVVIQGADIKGNGNLAILNSGHLYLLAGQSGSQVTQSTTQDATVGEYFEEEVSVSSSRAEVTQIDVAGDVTFHSIGDQQYHGSEIISGGDQTYRSEAGSIAFLAVKDTESYSKTESSSDFSWVTQISEGTYDETVRMVSLQPGGDLIVEAAEGVQVDVRKIDGKTGPELVDALVAENPDLAWMKQLSDDGEIDWNAVNETHQAWQTEHEGLGAGASAVIAIVVTVMTFGAGTALVGGQVAGATTASTAASLTLSQSAAAAASQAVITGAATQLTIGTINNGGKLDRSLSDLGQKDSLESLGVSALTAGLTVGLDALFDEYWTWGVTGEGVNNDSIRDITKGFDLGTWEGAAGFAAHGAGKAVITAGSQDLILGGSFDDYLEESLKYQGDNVLSALAFHWVGDVAMEKVADALEENKDLADVLAWAEGGTSKTLLHAAVGGAVSEATGGDFQTGAAAAGLNQAASSLLDGFADGASQTLRGSNDQWRAAGSEIAGVLGAALVEGDLSHGQWIAKQADTYNRQLHQIELEMLMDPKIQELYQEVRASYGLEPSDNPLRDLYVAAMARVDGQAASLVTPEFHADRVIKYLEIASSQRGEVLLHESGNYGAAFSVHPNDYLSYQVNAMHLYSGESFNDYAIKHALLSGSGFYGQHELFSESYQPAVGLAQEVSAQKQRDQLKLFMYAPAIPALGGMAGLTYSGSKLILIGGSTTVAGGYIRGGVDGAVGAGLGYAQVVSGVGSCAAIASCSVGSLSIIDGANGIYKAYGVGDGRGAEYRSLYSYASHEIFGEYRYGAAVDKFSSLISVTRGFTHGPAQANSDYELLRGLGSSAKGGYDFTKEIKEW